MSIFRDISRLPSDISSLIFSRLPARDVLACKCVSKCWLTMISALVSNQEFVQMHLNYHRENSTRLMFSDIDHEVENSTRIYSIGYDSLASLLLPQIGNTVETEEASSSTSSRIDGSEDSSSTSSGIDSFVVRMDYPFNDFGLNVRMVSSCNGLVCLWFHDDADDFFCLWNPATKEYRIVPQAPGRYDYADIQLYAFVYDTTDDDYEFVIAVSSEEASSELGSLVHIYTLKSNTWKSFLAPNCLDANKKFAVLFNGDLHYWSSLGSIVVSLDIRNEKFKEMQLPLEGLAILLVGVLEGCLCLLVEDEFDVLDIWIMQVYGDANSWEKRYTITHEIITKRISHHVASFKFMWSFKNNVILLTDSEGPVLYDLKHESVIERSVMNFMSSAENYLESFISLNSGTYAGGRMADNGYTQILWNRISALEGRNAELEADNSQLVANNAELQRKLHESQVAYQNLEQRVMLQKEAEGVKKDDKEEEETAITKKKGQKRKADHRYNTRKASKATGESTNFEDESFTVQQRAEKEGSKTDSTSKDSYQTMTVQSLRALLKERGLMVKGKKDELIARLRGK